MATSPEAFQKVKEILQKLDRSIDSARDRRLSGSPTPVAAPAPSVAPVGNESIPPQAAPGPLRARPMRTPDNGHWNSATGTTGHPGR